MNPMHLKNVVVGENTSTFYKLDALTELMPPKDMLNTVIWDVATKHPHWSIKVVAGIKHYNENAFTTHKFAVYQDKEKLGEIGIERYRRQNAIAISNERIRGTLDRGDTNYTKDTAKALSIIKKMFTTMNMQEHVDAGVKKADGVMKSLEWAAARKVRHAEDSLLPTIKSFAFHEKRKEFEEYVWKTYNGLSSMLEFYDKDVADMATITEIKELGNTGRACVVVMQDGRYAVQSKDEEIKVYDDSTLPDNLRGKLGLLKLVADQQMVTGAGCRVSDTVFIVATT